MELFYHNIVNGPELHGWAQRVSLHPVGTLKDGYVRNVPVPRVQRASLERIAPNVVNPLPW